MSPDYGSISLFSGDQCLNSSVSTGSRVVDLLASSTSRLAPGEVQNRHDEEAGILLDSFQRELLQRINQPICRVCDTGKSIVPCHESSEQTEEASSLDAAKHGRAVTVLKISDSEKQEGKVQEEEQEEEGHGRSSRRIRNHINRLLHLSHLPKSTHEQDRCEDEPSLLSLVQVIRLAKCVLLTIKKKPNESRKLELVPPPRAVTMLKPPGVKTIA
jgi:hypothetical protein